MLFSKFNAQKIPKSAQDIAHYAQIELTIILTKPIWDMRRLGYTIIESNHFSFTCAWIQKWAPSWLINPLPVHNNYVVVKAGRLTATCNCVPKILKIMPVDFYNASIIFKCLHTLVSCTTIFPCWGQWAIHTIDGCHSMWWDSIPTNERFYGNASTKIIMISETVTASDTKILNTHCAVCMPWQVYIVEAHIATVSTWSWISFSVSR